MWCAQPTMQKVSGSCMFKNNLQRVLESSPEARNAHRNTGIKSCFFFRKILKIKATKQKGFLSATCGGLTKNTSSLTTTTFLKLLHRVFCGGLDHNVQLLSSATPHAIDTSAIISPCVFSRKRQKNGFDFILFNDFLSLSDLSSET